LHLTHGGPAGCSRPAHTRQHLLLLLLLVQEQLLVLAAVLAL
jgi:hypothetical protein